MIPVITTALDETELDGGTAFCVEKKKALGVVIAACVVTEKTAVTPPTFKVADVTAKLVAALSTCTTTLCPSVTVPGPAVKAPPLMA